MSGEVLGFHTHLPFQSVFKDTLVPWGTRRAHWGNAHDPFSACTLAHMVEVNGSGVCPDLVGLLSPSQGKGHLPQWPGTQDTLFSEEH